MIWRIDLADVGLIAGVKPTKKRPSRLLDNLGRNEYPRKSNCTDGLDPVRLPDLQKTILVFCGCSSRRQVAKRSSIDAFKCLACASLRQWQITSSAYRSNGMSGNFRPIQRSNA